MAKLLDCEKACKVCDEAEDQTHASCMDCGWGYCSTCGKLDCPQYDENSRPPGNRFGNHE